MNVATVQLRLLGPLQLSVSGQDLTRQLRYQKGQALLAYLALHVDQHLSRRELAMLLWPELEGAAALTNLRQVLSPLARVLNSAGSEALLEVDRDRVRLRLLPSLELDVLALSASTDDVAAGTTQQRLEAQLLPQRQGFVAGLSLPDCERFEQWLSQMRHQLRERYRHVLAALCEAQQQAGRPLAALQSARARCALDPLDEAAAAELMRLLLHSGDTRGAAEVLAHLDQSLVSQLGQRASGATRRLLEHAGTQMPSSRVPQHLAVELSEFRWLALLQVEPRLPRGGQAQDDEAWAELLPLLQSAQAVARRWGGLVQAQAGGGFQALFGLQDDAEQAGWRSVLAAQELLAGDGAAAALALAAGAGRAPCSHAQGHWQVTGGLPQAVASLAAQAGAGELLLTEPLAGMLDTRLRCTRIEGAQGTLFRFVALRAVEPARERLCLGREEMLQALDRHWQSAGRGRPALVQLLGEAGLGKTTLAHAFAARLPSDKACVWRWSCRLEWQHQPLAPLRHALTRLPPALLAALPPALHPLMQGPAQAGVIDADMGPAWVDACFAWLDGLAARQPVLLWVDDLHWADQASRDLLLRYAAMLDGQRLMMLLTSRRPALQPSESPAAVLLELSPLSEDAGQQLLARLDPQGKLSTAQRRALLVQSGGVPLFIEALARRTAEGMAEAPADLGGLLQSELDRLGPVKPVLQAAALIGQRFPAALLTALLPDAEVPRALLLALQYRLLRHDSDGDVYEFRHALLQEAAAGGLLSAQRRQLHGRLARLYLEQGSPPDRRAPHHEGAGQWAEACDAWWQAALQALQGEFAADAQSSLERAWVLAQSWNWGDVLTRRALRLDLVRAAQMREGYGSARAHGLCRELLAELDAELAALPPSGEAARALQRLHFSVLSRFYLGAGSQGESLGLSVAWQLEAAAQDASERLTACFALGNSLFWRGRFADALRYLSEGSQLLSGLGAAQRGRYLGDDAGVLLLAVQCWARWFVGEQRAALDSAEQGVLLARQQGRVHSLCFMLSFAAAMHWTRGDEAGVIRHAGEAHGLAQRHGFPLWEGLDALFLSWADVRRGRLRDPQALIQAAEQFGSAYQAGRTMARWVMASSLVLLQQREPARQLLLQALDDAQRDEDHYCRPALLLLLSDCERWGGDWVQANVLSEQACELAARQGAVGWLRRHAPALVPGGSG